MATQSDHLAGAEFERRRTPISAYPLGAQKQILARDLIYVLSGVDSDYIQVMGGDCPLLMVDPSAHEDHAAIVHKMGDLALGVREMQRFIVQAFYSNEALRQALAKCLEEYLDDFFHRLLPVRRSFRSSEITLDSLCFIMEEDLYLFRELRVVLGDVEGACGGGLLELFIGRAARNTGARQIYSRLLRECLKPFNQMLSLFLEGKPVDEREFIAYETPASGREPYGFNECYWNKVFTKVPENTPRVLAEHVDKIITCAKCIKLLNFEGRARYSVSVPALLLQSDWLVHFDAATFDRICGEVTALVVDMVRPALAHALGVIRKTFLFGEFDRFAELFSELGPKLFRAPSQELVSAANYILKKSNEASAASFELKALENQSFSALAIADVSAFELTAEEAQQVKKPDEELAYVFNPVPFTRMLLRIHHPTKSDALGAAPSFLQGLDVLFAPSPPFSLFFTPKSLAGYRIVFRFLYSLYALEHHFGRMRSAGADAHRKIKYLVLVFVSGMRMFLCEHVIRMEWRKLEDMGLEIDAYVERLEECLRRILKGSLLTDIECIHAYDAFFRTSFEYIESPNRDMMTSEEACALYARCQGALRSLHGHLSHPYLASFVESLPIGLSSD